jgi:hypothetical protein
VQFNPTKEKFDVFSFDTGSKCALNSGTGRRDREAEWDG